MTDPIGAPPQPKPAGVPRRYGTAASEPPPPIRLQLEVDQPLLRLVRSMRSAVTQAPRAAAEEDQQPEPPKHKGRRRLRRVAVRSLELGQRQIAGTDELDIVAKFLYNRPRKIVCQMRRGDHTLLKIDILWSNIRAMAACFDHASFDTLRIEVKSPPEQYRADPPAPRRHLQWQRCPALTTRTFCLQFDKGTLERSYGKMLYTDPSLMLRTLPPPPPPPPPSAGDEEGSDESTATQQTVGMITAAAPVPPSVDAVHAEMPGTWMLGFTNTGANVATHQYSGTQSNDPSHTYASFVQMDVE